MSGGPDVISGTRENAVVSLVRKAELWMELEKGLAAYVRGISLYWNLRHRQN